MEFEWDESQTHFEDLHNGEVFYVDGDRRIVFMRVEDIYDSETNEVSYNAVNLSNATLVYFFPEEKVDKVKAKMVLS